MKPSPVTMTDRRTWAVPACVAIVLWGCTLLMCDVTGAKPGEAWPSWVTRVLAVPLRMTDISDLRYYAVPIGWAMALVIIAWKAGKGGLASDRFIRPGWFEALAAATVLWVCASALKNESWAQSRGWIFGLFCGVGWAATLGRWCAPRHVLKAAATASAIAVIASVLSLGHLQFLGERFFQLPVGPVTLTASLGAFWASIAVVWLIGAVALELSTRGNKSPPARTPPQNHHVRSKSPMAFAWAILVALLALVMLAAANRRGAWLGLIAAWTVIGALVGWHRYRGKGGRALLIAGILIAAGVAAWYVRGQARSAVVTTSLPLKVRSIYWETMLERIPRSPIWGFGPDRFVVKATTALSRRRAEEPRLLHGIVDYDGHNEWLQAAFELGVPGALLYLSLPLGAFIVACRRWRRAEGERRVWLLALMAGLAELCVSEASSINLRHSVLQGWYWTLIGLTVALSREDAPIDAAELPSLRNGAGRTAGRLSCGIAALAIVAVVGMDLQAALHHAKGRALLNHDDPQAMRELEKATGRFGASRWLSTRSYLGASLSNQLRADFNAVAGGATTRSASAGESDSLRRRVVEVWGEVYRECPGYLDTGFRMAEAQVMAGDRVGAKKTLQDGLRELDPYDRNSNVLLIQIGQLDPPARLECVRRTLRQDMWEPVLMATAADALKSPDVAGAWPARVEQALRDVAQISETSWQDPLAPETLRIEALRLAAAGDRVGADRVQREAARVYERLALAHDPHRRKWSAEVDAWYWSARFLFDLDPGKYQETYSRIERAEFLVADGLPTEAVLNAKPQGELIGGRVLPMEFPEKLSPLWRFSAMMHLAMKKEEGQISLRVTWSLPADQRSANRTFAELGSLAAELVRIYQPLPEPKRPPSYMDLIKLAQQFAPR